MMRRIALLVKMSLLQAHFALIAENGYVMLANKRISELKLQEIMLLRVKMSMKKKVNLKRKIAQLLVLIKNHYIVSCTLMSN